MRLDADGCGYGWTGTGFLVGPSLVATVAHNVENIRQMRVTSPRLGLATAATVIGVAHDHDLALIRTQRPLPGHLFTLERQQPPIGTEIGLIGFPLGRSMQLTIGHITDTHDRRPVGGEDFHVVLSNMLLTDAAQNPGNSGGPWVTRNGEVVALAESGPPVTNPGAPTPERAQGNNAGVPASDALTRIAHWQTNDQPVPGCGPPTRNASDAALETLFAYLYDINQSDYASAYAQLDPANHPPSALDAFIEGVDTSQDASASGTPEDGPLFDSGDVRTVGEKVYAEVRFRSQQDAQHGPHGLTCTDWHLRYEFIRKAGLWLIHNSTAASDSQAAYKPCSGNSTSAAGGTPSP